MISASGIRQTIRAFANRSVERDQASQRGPRTRNYFVPCKIIASGGYRRWERERHLGNYLSPHERVAHYRNMAAEALRHAATASDADQKAMYVDDAARWLALAVEVEHVWDRLVQGRR